tara:strand:- start:15628 stop:18663 length:3036 start_codon:yes stop_codon:yes gene_type:complete
MAATLRKYISVKAPSTGQDDLGKAIRTEVFAKNRLGGAVSYLGSAVQDFKEIAEVHTGFELDALQREKELDEKEHKHKVSVIEAQEDLLGRKKGREKDKASEALQEKQKAPAEKKKEGEKLAKKQKGKFGFLKNLLSPLNSLGAMLMKVLAPLLGMKLLEWVSKEENREALKKLFGFLSAVWKFSRALAGWGIDNVMKGITNIFGESDKTGVARIFEQMFGVLQLVGGLAALWAASRVLMPWKLIGDVKFMRGLGKAVSSADQQRMRPDRDGRRGGPDVDVDGRKRRAGSRERYERRFGKDAANRKFGKKPRPRGRKRRMLGGLMGMCPNPLDLLPDNTPKNVVDNVAKNADAVGDAAKATNTAVDLGEAATDVTKKAPKKLNWWQKLQKAGSNTVEGLKTGAKAGVDFIGDKAIKFGNWANKGMKSAWEATTATAQKFGTGIKNFAVETVDGLGTKAKKFFMEEIVAKVKPFVEPIIEQANKVGAKLMEGLQKIPGYDKVGKLFSEKGITNVATAGSKLGKRAAAVLPVIGGVVNLAFAYDRFAAGDSVGGLLESISGVLDIAGLATAGATNVASMFLDGYLFARDFIPALAEGEDALINTLGLGGLKSQLDSQLSKLPGLGELIGKLMNLLGFGEKEEEKARGGLLYFDGGGEYDPKGRSKHPGMRKREIKRLEQFMPSRAAGGELAKLGDGTALVNAAAGMCTTGVILTAERNKASIGAPHVATGNDPNNPRGLMAQAVGEHGYASIEGLGSSKRITSPYGNVNVNVMDLPTWTKAVKDKQIPSGALIFSTRHSDWNNAASSSGNDSAIAKEGGQKLWSGHWQARVNGVGAVYGAGTRGIVALTHPGGNKSGYDGTTNNVNAGSDSDTPGGSTNNTGDRLNADGTPQQTEPPKPKKIDIMEVFKGLGGADLMKSYIQDIRDDEARSSGSSVSGGGGSGAAQIKQEQDELNRKSQLLKTQSENSQQREEDLQGGSNNVMILTKKVFGATPPAPQIITPGSGMTPLLTGN